MTFANGFGDSRMASVIFGQSQSLCTCTLTLFFTYRRDTRRALQTFIGPESNYLQNAARFVNTLQPIASAGADVPLPEVASRSKETRADPRLSSRLLNFSESYPISPALYPSVPSRSTRTDTHCGNMHAVFFFFTFVQF